MLNDEDKQREEQDINDSVNAYESVNGGYKRPTDSELNWPKFELIAQLKKCSYKDSPREIARLLQEIFEPWPSKEGHWLWIAQRYTTRTINWQVLATIKEYKRGAIRKTPPVYFTFELKFRKKRKMKFLAKEDEHAS